MKMTLTVYAKNGWLVPEEHKGVPFVPRVGEWVVTKHGSLMIVQVVYNYEDRAVSVYV